MLHYKIIRGFGKGDWIPIDETELDKAIFCHVTGAVGAFKCGSITGAHISAIVPDLNAMMGWNPEYTLGPEDYYEARFKKNEAQEYCGLVTSHVKNAIETRNTASIGNTDYRALGTPETKQISAAATALAEKWSTKSI